MATERLHSLAKGLDFLPYSELADILTVSQVSAAMVVQGTASQFTHPAKRLAHTIINQGCIHYAAAGSSGLMAAADVMELGGTFSISPSQLQIHMAGGLPNSVSMPGNAEDDIHDLANKLSELTEKDTMIAISASGSTPYTLAAADIAKQKQARLIVIANNDESALLNIADYPIFLPTPPEVLAGSTRLGAATAQKIALNTLSTMMGVHLGHVYDGMMVNVFADNNKLKSRALSIVCQISNVPPEEALEALEASGGSVKPAILIAAGNISNQAATRLLKKTYGHLRPALESITTHK